MEGILDLLVTRFDFEIGKYYWIINQIFQNRRQPLPVVDQPTSEDVSAAELLSFMDDLPELLDVEPGLLEALGTYK